MEIKEREKRRILRWVRMYHVAFLDAIYGNPTPIRKHTQVQHFFSFYYLFGDLRRSCCFNYKGEPWTLNTWRWFLKKLGHFVPILFITPLFMSLSLCYNQTEKIKVITGYIYPRWFIPNIILGGSFFYLCQVFSLYLRELCSEAWLSYEGLKGQRLRVGYAAGRLFALPHKKKRVEMKVALLF